MADTLEKDGFRLYRRTDRDLLVPGREAVAAGTYAESVPACAFYPRAELLSAYLERGELLGGLPYVNGLDFNLMTLDGPANVREAYFSGGAAGIASFGELGFICGGFDRLVEREAVEGVEAVYSESPRTPGWNAGAVSAEAFFKSGRVKFRVQAGERFLIGIGTSTDPTKLGFGMDNTGPIAKFVGFFIDGDYVTSVVRGYGDEGSLTTGATVGGAATYVPYDDTTIHTVELKGNVVTLSRADRANTVWSGAFSLIFDAPDVWMLSAALWTPGTWVEGIEVVAYSGSDAALPAMQGRAGQGTPQNSSIASLPMLTLDSRPATTSAGAMPKMKALGGRAIGQAETELPGLRAAGQEELELAGLSPRSSRTLPALKGSGRSLVGSVGRAQVDLPLMRARGSQGNRAEAAVSLPPLATYAFAWPEGEVRMPSFSAPTSVFSPFVEGLVVMDSAGVLSGVLGVSVLLDAAMDSTANALDSSATVAILRAAMEARALTGTELPHDGASGEVWAVSLADTPASSTFENYDFNSFGVLGEQAFGVMDDGVYMLSGDTDGGDPIRASLSFGKQDFNSKTEKHMTRAYVGASSVGTLYLKIIANGSEYVYAARSSSTELAQQRFDVGRGLQANYFTFELFNKDGGDFELDSVTFFAAEFKRRI